MFFGFCWVVSKGKCVESKHPALTVQYDCARKMHIVGLNYYYLINSPIEFDHVYHIIKYSYFVDIYYV